MRANRFVHDSTLSSRKPHNQLESLQTACFKAMTAKSNNNHLPSIAGANVSSQAFAAAVDSGSVAEKTVKRYKADPSLDLSNNVVEPEALDAVPFPMICKLAIWSAPNFSNVDEAEVKSLFSSAPSMDIKHVRQRRSDSEPSPFEFAPVVKPINNIPVELAELASNHKAGSDQKHPSMSLA
jgi:hypothetical protein